MTVQNYGFLIDNRRCIGCHACTTACKSENAVPLGVNRTWVKYTEKGVFPDTRRYFQVTRCNHCANPPCVHICPTAAMFRRADGIVEFNNAYCIGCKACMQACPYDAIYIDPETHTAAKCHYCAHRTDIGLEPACVVVCPVHAIIAGDLSDADSEIARAVGTRQVRVRKPEQGTQPKLFYIDAEESSIVPGLARQDSGMLWATRPEGDDWRGPLKAAEGRMAGALVNAAAAPRETYNTPHRVPWHWPVPAYLVSKALATGLFMITGAFLLGVEPPPPSALTVAPLLLSLLFTALTAGLLVFDLDQPKRFFYMLIRPQWRSWLTRGAFALIGFSALATLVLLTHLLAFEETVQLFAWLAMPLAVLAAVYTAFLFAQAEGRDLWQSPLLAVHLFVQALMAGAAGFLVLRPFIPNMGDGFGILFGVCAALNLLMTLGGEFGVPHASQVAATAAHMITAGRYQRWFWFSIIGGLALPVVLALLAGAMPLAGALAGLLAIAGLFAYEWAYVMAPQQVPNN